MSCPQNRSKFMYRIKSKLFCSVFFFSVEKHDHTLPDKSMVNDTILTDVNPAYGEVKNTNKSRTVYDTVQ